MKLFFSALVATFSLLALSTHAAEGQPPTQQNKMKACNAEAKTKALKGAERKTFMSACLKAK
ncbi:MAG: psiF repeat [Pseudomonadota bacterium]